MASSDEGVIFENSPLFLCLVIDARHGSRTSLVKSIKASQYFQEIKEARSVPDGVEALILNEVDACIVGSSLSGNAAVEFVKQGLENTKSKDCAFLAILPEGSVMAEQLVAAGCHGVLEEPYKRFEFRDALIHAVVRANANSPWRGILLNELGSEEALEEVLYQVIRKEPSVQPVCNPFEGLDKSVGDGRSLAKIIGDSPERLASVVNCMLRGRTEIEKGHEPTKATRFEIKAMLSSMLEQFGGTVTFAHFADYLGEALLQWFTDFNAFDREQATELLKKRLLEYAAL